MRWVWIFVFGAVLLMKDPFTQLTPVLWAEEASVYLNHALDQGPLSILFFVYERSMRFELLMNISAATAALMPLKMAPYIAAAFSFSVYLLSFHLLLSRKLYLFPKRWQRILGCLGVLLCCFSLPKVFLSTAVIQHTIGCVALILLCARNGTQRSRSIWPELVILTICGLSGLYAVFLAPLFVLKALLTRNRDDSWAALVLCACLCIQLTVMVQAGDKEYTSQFRGIISMDSPLIAFRVLVLKTIVGESLSRGLMSLMPSNLIVGPLLFVLGLASWSYWIHRRGNNMGEWFLLLAWVLSATAVMYSAAGGVPDGRYAGLPRTILFFTITQFLVMRHPPPQTEIAIGPSRTARSRTPGIVFGIALASIVLNGLMVHFRDYDRARREVPRWIDEIDRFQAIGNYLITVYPAPRWKVNLNPNANLYRFVPITTDRIYEIDDFVYWVDFYQLEQPAVRSNGKRYISQSTVLLELNLDSDGRYQLEALTQALDGKHDSWYVRTEWIRRKTIPWHIPVSDFWQWSAAPEIWNLSKGKHRFLLEPREPTPLAAIRVRTIE